MSQADHVKINANGLVQHSPQLTNLQEDNKNAPDNGPHGGDNAQQTPCQSTEKNNQNDSKAHEGHKGRDEGKGQEEHKKQEGQIQLGFQKETNKESTADKGHIIGVNKSNNRPSSLHIPSQFGHVGIHRWRQCKIIGKNVSKRSYSASCAFNNRFYMYGGYQILNGSLSDFYYIDLDNELQQFKWVQIQQHGEDQPGIRSKHSLIASLQSIYLLGGLHNNLHSSNDIYKFEVSNSNWIRLQPKGDKLPPIDSFGAAYFRKDKEQKIYILCGYNENIMGDSNAVYEYNITQNHLKIVFYHSESNGPSPRSGCAVAESQGHIYIFGGKDANQRKNDLWKLNLNSYKFTKIQNQDSPCQRNGHSMNAFQNQLYVFGGIKDITWELDDLHIYSIASDKWTILEQDSPRKINRKHLDVPQNKQDIDQKRKGKKIWYETIGHNGKSPRHGNSYYNHKTMHEEENKNSPGKMVDQQRKKIFNQKKAQLLKNFQVDSSQNDKFVSLETSSQAMKNSLDVIGSVSKEDSRLTEFGKESVSKFLGPLQNNATLIPGKKPCARDGHCSAIIKGELIIFGGDRHLMSFNDIYKLNFSMAQ